MLKGYRVARLFCGFRNVECVAGGVSHAFSLHDCFNFPGGGDGSIRNWPGSLFPQECINVCDVIVHAFPHVNHVQVRQCGLNIPGQDVKHRRNRVGVCDCFSVQDKRQDAGTVFVDCPCQRFTVFQFDLIAHCFNSFLLLLCSFHVFTISFFLSFINSFLLFFSLINIFFSPALPSQSLSLFLILFSFLFSLLSGGGRGNL